MPNSTPYYTTINYNPSTLNFMPNNRIPAAPSPFPPPIPSAYEPLEQRVKRIKKNFVQVAPGEPRSKKITPLKILNGFSFYLEETVGGSIDPFSQPPREYWVESLTSKARVELPVALKIGVISGEDIDADMYDFLHEYDKGLN